MDSVGTLFPLEVICSNCPSQGGLHNHQLDVQTDFDNLWGRLHGLSGQHVPVLHHLHCKEVFPDVQWESPVYQFVLLVSCPVLNHWKKPVTLLFALSLQVSVYVDPSWAPFSLGWTISILSASLDRRAVWAPLLSWSSFGFFTVAAFLACTGGPRAGHGIPGAASTMLRSVEEEFC